MVVVIRAEELVGVWRELTLTKEEMDCVEVEGVQGVNDAQQGKKWIVGKLLTTRSLNKDAMLSILRVVWRF